MIKVLVVDDEVLVRHDLQTMIDWEAHGFVICGEATNGQEALEMTERTEPHIVVLDINMPGMDGVTLCRTLQERHPEIKKIVLSSYDKFDYVRDTLKNGAVDYLLKHEMNGRALLDVLEKARNELTEEARKTKLWEAISPSVVQSAIRDLLLGRTDNLEQIRSFPGHPIPVGAQNFVVAVLQIEHFFIITGSFSDAEKNKFIQSALELCQRTLHDLKNAIACHVDQGKFVVLFFFEQHSHYRIGQQVSDALFRIRRSLEMYLDIRIAYEHSGVIQGLAGIHDAYERTCKRLKQRVFASGSGGDHVDPQIFTLSLDHERRLMTAAKLGDEPGCHAIIDEVFAPFKEQRNADDAVQLLVNELIHIANKVWVKSGMSKEKYYEDNLMARERFKPADRMQDTVRWLKQLYSQLIHKLSHAETGGQHSAHVEMAVRYIARHYADEISLEAVAGHIGITPSYLSRLFREEMKCGFTEYVNKVRIKAAQRYIESGEYKIKDICEKVGFTSYNYFFKVFKDITGVTPQSYGKHVR